MKMVGRSKCKKTFHKFRSMLSKFCKNKITLQKLYSFYFNMIFELISNIQHWQKAAKMDRDGIEKIMNFLRLSDNNIICSMQITIRQFMRAQELNCLLNAHLIMLFCILR